jgi:hypothetical protein
MRAVPVYRGVALLMLLVVLVAPAVYADDPNPFEPPAARIRPPGGVASGSEPGFFESLIDWVVLYARISPPIG